MPSLFIRRVLRVPGRFARANYMRLRRFLPNADPIRYGGIAGPRYRKLGDRRMTWLVPDWEREDIPGYELGIMQGLQQTVRSGDRIVVVGGGMGITASAAALLAGATGAVTCYEGNLDSTADIALTALNNRVADRNAVHAVIVGEAIGVYDGPRSPTVLPPGELPECDVLQLDCEGAERIILETMTIRPRAIVVETHGFFGAPTAQIRQKLEAIGYVTADLGIAEPRFGDMCVIRDVHVLVATRA